MFMRLATSDADANMRPVDSARGPASPPEPLRVAIVEDDVTTREGLAALIGGTPGYRCVGWYGSVEELMRKPPDRAADVVLLDINLPGISGGEGVRLVRERWSSTEVLMLR
jgi:DNA-binding NarL/FixJ family response regulator